MLRFISDIRNIRENIEECCGKFIKEIWNVDFDEDEIYVKWKILNI